MPSKSPKKKPVLLTPENIQGTGLEFLKEESLVRIEILGEETPNGSLLILESDFEDIAHTAAQWIAATLLGGDFPADYHKVVPDAGGEVTVQDMDGLLARVDYHPLSRHVVLLPCYAGARPGVMDRLLMLLEDTKVPLLVVLCTRDSGTLPDTVVGRASATVALEVLPPDLRQEHLSKLGFSSLASRESVEIAGNQPHLAAIFAKSTQLRAFAKSALMGQDPARLSIVGLLKNYANLCALAKAVANFADYDPKSFLKEVRYDSLSASEQECARKLLQLWSYHQRSHIHARIKRLDPGTAVDDCREMLEKLDAFERTLRVPTPPILAFGVYGA